MATPIASIVVPAFNVDATIYATLRSLLGQTFTDFELIVVDDGSTDMTLNVVAGFDDPRLRVVRQANRGLAGAHNTGIAESRGRYIGFCDADDLWAPEKLAIHVAHLDAEPAVGISFSGSAFIDADGAATGLFQRPRLKGIDAAHVLKRNPIGNGSAPVMRRAALDDIAWRPKGETRDWWFDETFRQSDDIEGWLRFALKTRWRIEGVEGALTLYRVNGKGLSANTDRQYETWERMIAKLTPLAPAFFARHAPAARAYQLRYLCRRAITARDGARALRLAGAMLRASPRPMVEEPLKTATTLAATVALTLLGQRPLRAVEALLRASAAVG